MVNDISKNVVLVMLVLAIVISVTGTWLVLDNIDKASVSEVPLDTVTEGVVKLAITEPAEPQSGNVELSITS